MVETMADPPGPLYEAAWYVGKVGTNFHDLALAVRDIVWIGTYCYRFFWWLYEESYRVAHHLALADRRIESLGWDEFIWSPGAWLLVRLGADVGSATYYRNRPWAWIIWRIRKEYLLLDALLSGDLYWIRDYILNRWPFLGEIALDPRGWVWSRIKERWWEVDEIIYHPGRWLLVKMGADIGYAEYYKDRPWAWFIWKFRKEHPPLDALLSRDTRWLFSWFQETIDEHLDTHISWLVRTCTRVLNLIWQLRL